MQSDPELQRVVDRLAALLGMPLTLEDADQQLIVYSAHEDLIDDMRRSSILRRATSRATIDYFDEWGLRDRRAPFLVPGSEDRGVLPRVCLPLRRDGQLVGLVWGLLSHEFDALPEMPDPADLLSELVRVLSRTFEENALGSELLLGLLSPLQEQRDAAAERIAERPGLGAGQRFVVIVCESDRWDHPSVRRSFWNTPLTRPGVGQIKALRPDRGVALIAGAGGDPVDSALLGSALTTVRRAADGAATLLAVGSVVLRAADACRSFDDAVRTARAGRALGQEGVIGWAGLGALRFLTRLDADELRDSIDPRFSALLEDAPQVAEALGRYLDAAGSVKQVADEMHIHRATLHQRLERLADFDIDLRSGRDRLAMHTSLIALRLLGEHA